MNLIAAIAANGALGYRGDLPWRPIPEDMKHFLKLTTGGLVIMGSATFFSDLKGQPLPNRKNLILTRNPNSFDFPLPHNTYILYDIKFAADVANQLEPDTEKQWVIGGASIYKQFLDMAQSPVTSMYITHIHQAYPADRFFHCNWSNWQVSTQELKEGYSFTKYIRL